MVDKFNAGVLSIHLDPRTSTVKWVGSEMLVDARGRGRSNPPRAVARAGQRDS